jgi:hypothetical protein
LWLLVGAIVVPGSVRLRLLVGAIVVPVSVRYAIVERLRVVGGARTDT